MGETATVSWTEAGESHQARWLSESGAPAPRTIVTADDRTTANDAYALAAQGSFLLWRGDFHNARQLLTAMASRMDRHARKRGRGTAPRTAAASFHQHRQAQGQRARTLGALLIPLAADYAIPLRRAPDARAACREAFGPDSGPALVSLRALLGAIGAHQWRMKGIEVAATGGRIHPHYGVFAPIRAEYVELLASEPLPFAAAAQARAFDIGTGTGVLAAVLARRGLGHVVATDVDPRALACARENLERLGLAGQVELNEADLYPTGRADLVVCNPPWLPARPSSPSSAASTTRTARCCAASWRLWARTSPRAARAGSCSRTWPSACSCVRARNCWGGSPPPAWRWWAGARRGPRTARPRMYTTRCTRRAPAK